LWLIMIDAEISHLKPTTAEVTIHENATVRSSSFTRVHLMRHFFASIELVYIRTGERNTGHILTIHHVTVKLAQLLVTDWDKKSSWHLLGPSPLFITAVKIRVERQNNKYVPEIIL
jgi:hypothetical protein